MSSTISTTWENSQHMWFSHALSFYPTNARWVPQLWQLKMTPFRFPKGYWGQYSFPWAVLFSGWHLAGMALFSPLNMKGALLCWPMRKQIKLANAWNYKTSPTHKRTLHSPALPPTCLDTGKLCPNRDSLSIPDSWDNKAFFIYPSYLIKLRCCER